MTPQIVAFGARCDLDDPKTTPDGMHYRVHEFAILEDGSRIIIRDGLGSGFSTRRPKPWDWLTREFIEHEIRTNIVVPDETYFVDDHPYEWLCVLLAEQGIETSEEHLRSLPYTVEFSEDFDGRLEEIRSH